MYYIRTYNIRPCDYTLWEVLQLHGIKCYGLPGYAKYGEYIGMYFHVDEHLAVFTQIEPFLPLTTETHNADGSTLGVESPSVTIRYYPQYTEKDCRSANWLEMRPVSLKIEPKNSETIFQHTCECGESSSRRPRSYHCLQVESVVVSKRTPWTNTQFFCTSYFIEGVFCNSRAKSILESSGLCGLRFDPVLKSRGGVLPDTHQVRAQSVLPDSAFFAVADMVEQECPLCGLRLLCCAGGKPLFGIYTDAVAPGIDFFETAPIFAGSPRASGTDKFIISQRAYRYLTEMQMTRAVEFIPLTERHRRV